MVGRIFRIVKSSNVDNGLMSPKSTSFEGRFQRIFAANCDITTHEKMPVRVVACIHAKLSLDIADRFRMSHLEDY